MVAVWQFGFAKHYVQNGQLCLDSCPMKGLWTFNINHQSYGSHHILSDAKRFRPTNWHKLAAAFAMRKGQAPPGISTPCRNEWSSFRALSGVGNYAWQVKDHISCWKKPCLRLVGRYRRLWALFFRDKRILATQGRTDHRRLRRDAWTHPKIVLDASRFPWQILAAKAMVMWLANCWCSIRSLLQHKVKCPVICK